MLTERLRESIRLRFVLVFMGTLLLTGICTFPTILISEAQRVMTEIETQLGEQAVRIEALDRKEPKNIMSEAHEAWGEQHEELEDLEDEILDLLDEL